jgi:hypothetical protein
MTDAAMSNDAGEHGSMGAQVRGLAVAEDGIRLVVEDPQLRQGQTGQLRFKIVDERGRAVRNFDLEHTKRMHLIVVRRDLEGFQHLHPTMRADGEWTVALRLSDAGSYRVFADFSYAGKPTTLAGEVHVDGYAKLEAIPAPAPVARTDDGYAVRLESSSVRGGRESELRFTVTKHGQPVAVERYLGADGHLVALRDGDLAFLHVHPIDQRSGRDGSIRFDTALPTAGSYRLFLQFKHDGKVRTVAFTERVS